MKDRRKFLLSVAKGAIYATPLIRTLAAPPSLHAIPTSGKGMMGMGMGMGMLVVTPTSKAPWSEPPPGATPPTQKLPGPPGSSNED